MASFKDWIAFEELHRPQFREHGAIYFSNSNKPSRDFNYAFCEVSRALFRPRVCCNLWRFLGGYSVLYRWPPARLISHIYTYTFTLEVVPTFAHVHTLNHSRKQTYVCSHSFFRSFFIRSPTHFLSDALLPTRTFLTLNLINHSSLLSLFSLCFLTFLHCSFISSLLPFFVVSSSSS